MIDHSSPTASVSGGADLQAYAMLMARKSANRAQKCWGGSPVRCTPCWAFLTYQHHRF